LTYTAEEESTIANNQSQIKDYFDVAVAQFILGTKPLNDSTWAEFVNQLKALGATENLQIMQTAYDKLAAR
jgi:GH24 family phage-related lysozyme (muramidase)